MTEMNTLIRKRGSVKAKLTSFKTHFEKTQLDLENVQSTENQKQLLINELETRIGKFDSCLNEFENLQETIEELATEANLENHYKEREDFEDEYYKIITAARDLVNKNKQINSTSVTLDTNVNSSENKVSKQYNHINVPNIQLPSFNGKFENWTEFRNTFITLIQNNKDLNDLERFHYLRSSLIEDASGTLRSIPFAGENYSVAWEHLCKRYDNKSMIVVNHIKAIDSLPVLQRESFRDLSNLIDEIDKHLTSWNSVQNASERFETLIIHIIKSKLDKYTRMKWEEQKTGDTLPTWEEFNAFLQERTEKLYSREINNKPEIKQRSVVKTFLVTSKRCPNCQEEHTIYKCKKLLDLKPADRLEQVKKLKLCTNCLRSNHINRDCVSGGCRICKAKHNTLLHFTKSEEKSTSNNREVTDSVVSLSSRFQPANQINQTSNVILSTIRVQVRDETGYPIVCRALLDSGSQANFISTRLQQRLQIPTQNIQVAVQGITQTTTMLKYRCQVLLKSINSDYSTEITCFVLDAISNNIPNVSINKNQFNIPPHIKLADPQFNEPQQIDLIIGAPLFWKIICVGQHNLGDNMPVLQKTRFGWIMGGTMETIHQPSIIQCNIANTSSIEEQIEKFWSIEEVNQKGILSDDDRKCEEIYEKTITQNSNGRFIVTIPFKESLSLLGSTKESARQRFHALERRLAMNPFLCHQYGQFMKEYEELGHMSEDLDHQASESPEYFFPHHGVINSNSTTTKLRVVFDGSAKSDTGISINSLQYIGPNIQEELINIILRFRMYNVVITADIEKMFRQILVRSDQRSLQKIFWRPNPEEPIKIFKLNTITYGTASAPFLAVRCLKQLAKIHEQQLPKISRIIADDFYMDDLITGATTTEEMQNIITEIVTVMKSVGFNLRKWTSNEPEIIKNQLSLSNTEVHFDTKDNTKILGLYWCSDSDTLRFKINSKINGNNRITKRIVISELAQIFDPLGLLGPCIIMGKIIIQKLWVLKLSWDESVLLDIHTQWLNFRSQLPSLNEKQIQRQVICKNAINIQLHGFCDSSERAYGACVYLRSQNSNKVIQVKLLCSKTRVAPLKTITIPRLELCSAVLLSKLIQKVSTSLRMTINQIYLWSDSTITLNWIRTEPYKLNIFVANRVNQIHQLTNLDNWRYVNTRSNPADLLTRGITPLMLIQNAMWWSGPTWLKEREDQWPQAKCEKLVDVPETKRNCITSMQIIQSPSWIPFNRFSRLSSLKRTIAYCLRFLNNCKTKKENHQYGELTSVELDKAFLQIIKCSQHESFGQEIKNLKDKNSISAKSKLYRLNVFLDDAGLLRVGGRLHNSPIPYDQKHPKVLSNSHPLTRLLLLYEHQRLLHIGAQGLIASIRQEFWPISVRNLAKNIIHNCTTCFKSKPKNCQAIMGNLPETRVTPSLPFTNVGIDFAGPFMIKNKDGRGWKPIKTYVCVFICMSTKAIHLEVVSGLSTELFLASLRRFASRRGKPTHIFSDNGTNFVGANRQINEMYRLITHNQQELIRETASENITWHFIPPYAPNFGGLWESAVKMMKNHLIKTVKNAMLTYEQLNTLLNQIEAILNSRPLLPLTDNPGDLETLTPSHFLIGKTLTSIPDPNLISIPENRLSVWQRIQQIQQHFWARWQREYLAELQQRQRRGKTETTLKIGDLVIVKDENLPVLKWLVGRITKLFPGNDGVVRVVLIKTGHGEIKRAISKLCVLPAQGCEPV